jgi:hypothetical protein
MRVEPVAFCTMPIDATIAASATMRVARYSADSLSSHAVVAMKRAINAVKRTTARNVLDGATDSECEWSGSANVVSRRNCETAGAIVSSTLASTPYAHG